MGLSDDQKALLRLLAKREEGYEDIAALKGLSVEEVRAEVQQALDALQKAGEEPPAPPAEEPAPPSPDSSPAEPPPPAPSEPEAAPPVAPPPAPGAKPPSRAAGALSALPPERRRLLLITGGALAVVAVVLIAIAVLGDSSDSSSSTANGSGGSNAENVAAENGQVTQAVLTAADGGDASGRAIFGRLGKEEIVLQVTAEGLEPSQKGTPYMVWLYRTPKLSLRVGSTSVDESGRLGARFAIPAELLAYVASGAFNQVYVSRTSNVAYRRAAANAKQNNAIPRYNGETVLTGEITGPIARAGREGN